MKFRAMLPNSAQRAGARKLAEKFAVALLTATLFFGRQIANVLEAENQFFLHWERYDSLALVLVVLTVAVVATGLSESMIRMRFHLARRVFNHIFVLAAAFGLLSFAFRGYPLTSGRVSVGWLVVAGLLGSPSRSYLSSHL